MGKNIAESIMGAVVLIIAGTFLYLFYSTAWIDIGQGYELTAGFEKIGGLRPGSDVRVNGITVGSVIENSLLPDDLTPIVRMSIKQGVKLPTDTVAMIASEGILGGKYVRLKPGSAKTFLAAGEEIKNTEDFQSLEDQVGRIIFFATSDPLAEGGTK